MPRASVGRQGLANLRAWREYRGYSQSELAERAQVSKPTIVHLESGKGTANWTTVAKLAVGLGITREQLLHAEPQ